MEATARIFYQKAPAKRTVDNLCPVKLCITKNQERRYYSIAKKVKDRSWLFVSEDDIKSITCSAPRGKYRDMFFEFERIKQDAQDIINVIVPFSFNKFEEKYLNKVKGWDNVFSAMWDHIQGLKAEDRIGYASSFESTLRAIKEFHTGKKYSFNDRKDSIESRMQEYTSGKPLAFIDITPEWLKRFETYWKKEKSRSTIGIYVRNIRVLFNVATKYHGVKAANPFEIHKPKTASRRKTALTAEQISLIANYQTEHPQEIFYRDIFMFSFLACGMNLSDIARLKQSNIKNNEVVFVRKKTEAEELDEVALHIPISKTMRDIIEKHGIILIGVDGYLFPVLRQEWDEKKCYAAIKQLTKQVNKYVGQIASKVGINEKVSSYSARHSWATISKNSGASMEFISESLGHSDLSVTKRYLKSFERSTREDHSKKMEDAIFNKKAV